MIATHNMDDVKRCLASRERDEVFEKVAFDMATFVHLTAVMGVSHIESLLSVLCGRSCARNQTPSWASDLPFEAHGLKGSEKLCKYFLKAIF